MPCKTTSQAGWSILPPEIPRSVSEANLARRIVAEAIGTALLLIAIVGSGIMAERLAGGNLAVALLANALCTAAALVSLILAFGAVSGAHFNPTVTLLSALHGTTSWREVVAYWIAQIAGALLGVALSNAMFGLGVFTVSHHDRSGAPVLLGEFIATFGLLSVIWACARVRASAAPYAVGSYIFAAIWFTSSTAFANPAVTIARSLTDSFTGINPANVPGFLVAELLAALYSWLVPKQQGELHSIVAPRTERIEMAKGKVLFVCVQNSARSQMAEAWVNSLCGDFLEARSAGIEPGKLNPLAIDVMREVGIDIADKKTAAVYDLFKSGARFNYVITVCDEASAERCPVFPGVTTRLHWSFPDPAAFEGTQEEKLDKCRQVRDAIKHRIEAWCDDVCRLSA